MIVACVRTGAAYPVSDVLKLRSMVARHLPIPHEFVCVTDAPEELPEDMKVVPVGPELPKWFAKMKLFDPSWRGGRKVLYLDLDTVLADDLSPLASIESAFAILRNLTRAAGHKTWPCAYGSAVMVIGSSFGDRIWKAFSRDRESLMAKAGKYGDQLVIEWLHPHAAILQDLLPPGYVIGWREVEKAAEEPVGAAVVCFAGSHKVTNCDKPWIKEHWR